jgi:hypothetical protein
MKANINALVLVVALNVWLLRVSYLRSCSGGSFHKICTNFKTANLINFIFAHPVLFGPGPTHNLLRPCPSPRSSTRVGTAQRRTTPVQLFSRFSRLLSISASPFLSAADSGGGVSPRSGFVRCGGSSLSPSRFHPSPFSSPSVPRGLTRRRFPQIAESRRTKRQRFSPLQIRFLPVPSSTCAPSIVAYASAPLIR